jgi:tryptophan synthase beta chain
MTAYMNYNAGNMTDHIPTDEELQVGFDSLPKID